MDRSAPEVDLDLDVYGVVVMVRADGSGSVPKRTSSLSRFRDRDGFWIAGDNFLSLVLSLLPPPVSVLVYVRTPGTTLTFSVLKIARCPLSKVLRS